MKFHAYVLHNSEFLLRGRSPKDFPLRKENLILVAIIETSNQERAFQMTQHIHCSWWMNPKVNCVLQSRSTSVGDVIIIKCQLEPDEAPVLRRGWSSTDQPDFYEVQDFGMKRYEVHPFDISDLFRS